VVRNHKQLAERVSWVISTYKQPALVEEYLPGREFTVGFIGNQGTKRGQYRTNLYDGTGYHWFPVLEIDTQSSISPGIYGHAAKEKEIHADGAPEYLCPADISEELSGRLINLARRAAQALEVLDFGRVDFRMGARGEPYLLEINTLPGLNPSLSDLCIMAQAEGVQYDTLITEILYLAAERYDLPSLTADLNADPEKNYLAILIWCLHAEGIKRFGDDHAHSINAWIIRTWCKYFYTK
jgi:D-alanine-D-alanine ligase